VTGAVAATVVGWRTTAAVVDVGGRVVVVVGGAAAATFSSSWSPRQTCVLAMTSTAMRPAKIRSPAVGRHGLGLRAAPQNSQ
jgi:hypothetical protein